MSSAARRSSAAPPLEGATLTGQIGETTLTLRTSHLRCAVIPVFMPNRFPELPGSERGCLSVVHLEMEAE